MDYSIFITQLDSLIDSFHKMQKDSKYDDLSDLPSVDRQALVTRSLAAIARITGPRSTYSEQAEALRKKTAALHLVLFAILGVVQGLREDLNAGYLRNFAEIVHAEVFSDFLDMAKHLNDAGYKDPAAVIAGSTLEGHLKELATKNAIPTEVTGRPVKADKLNADLAKAGVYPVLDQKQITANLDLRNAAAHGKYTEYTKQQVDSLISSVTDFIRRTPA